MQMLRIFYCIFYGCVNCRFCCTLMRVYIWSLHRTPRLCRLLFVPPFCCPVQCQKGMNVNESRWNTKKPLRCGSRIDAGNGNNNYSLHMKYFLGLREGLGVLTTTTDVGQGSIAPNTILAVQLHCDWWPTPGEDPVLHPAATDMRQSILADTFLDPGGLLEQVI